MSTCRRRGGDREESTSCNLCHRRSDSTLVPTDVGTANVLEPQVKDGRALVGAMAIAVPGDIPEGSNVRAIVALGGHLKTGQLCEVSTTGRFWVSTEDRAPHDVRITKGEPSDHKEVGRVRRIARLGAYMNLDLGSSAW